MASVCRPAATEDLGLLSRIPFFVFVMGRVVEDT